MMKERSGEKKMRRTSVGMNEWEKKMNGIIKKLEDLRIIVE